MSIAILGGGVSGQAARRLAQDRGYEVVVFDEAASGASTHFLESTIRSYDRIVVSPGFAEAHPWRIAAEKSGVLCQTETAFAASHWRGKLIGVTGTNGKTTTTELLTSAFKEAGHDSISVGNIGFPLSDAVLLKSKNHEATWAVCELSSYQAELSGRLGLDGLLWTNFAEDHLDRYQSMSNYFQAKARLLECLRPNSLSVVGSGLVHWFKVFDLPLGNVVVADNGPSLIERLSEHSVFLRHPYRENFSVVEKFWQLIGEPGDALVRAADSFQLAPHRLRLVRKKKTVRFWNDSKATNFHAALAAINALDGPIVWIGGGQGKGGDIDSFGSEVSARIEAAVCYGEVGPRLLKTMSGSSCFVRFCPLFKDAVAEAYEIARGIENANVLMSPGFASFDQFESYDERGKSFNSIVLSL